MSWQDVVIGAGQAAFVVALLPTVFGPSKPDKYTCLLTAVVLSVFVPTFWSLGLRWGPVTCAMAAILWWILYGQAVIAEPPEVDEWPDEPEERT
jgi:hypothetical protein